MRRLAVLLVLVAAIAACGTPSPDLFVVTRSGDVPGADLDLLVSDGTVTCNDAEPVPLSNALLLEARDIADELLELQQEAPPPPASNAQVFSFAVRTEEGILRFADTSRTPEVLGRVTRLTRTIAQDACGLER